MTLLISYLFLTIYYFLEIINESANSINDLNDSQVICTVSNDQVQEFTTPRVTNKDDDLEKTFSPQNENSSPVLRANVKRFVKK